MDATASLGIVCVGGGIVFSSATKWRGGRKSRSERGWESGGEGKQEVEEGSEKRGAKAKEGGGAGTRMEHVASRRARTKGG
jgi:hypothetical protein